MTESASRAPPPPKLLEVIDARVEEPLGQDDVARLARQLPDPRTIDEDGWVALRVKRAPRPFWVRWRRQPDGPNPALAAACTALLAAGYVDISSDGSDTAYGAARPSRH